MPNDLEAQATIDGVNGMTLGGRVLTVNEAHPREDWVGRAESHGARGGMRQEGTLAEDIPSSYMEPLTLCTHSSLISYLALVLVLYQAHRRGTRWVLWGQAIYFSYRLPL